MNNKYSNPVMFGFGSSGSGTNVQSDWNVTDTSSDAYILHKPDLTVYQNKSEKDAVSGYAGLDSNGKLSTSVETDPTVPSWAKATTKPSYNFSEIGLKPTTLSGYGITDGATTTYVDGKIEDTIVDGHTTVAPSSNAVFDALALKAPLVSPAFTNPTGVLHSFTATLPYASWTGSSAPYTKAVTVSGILSTDLPSVDLDLSGTTYSNVATIQTSWANVYRAVTSADTITFYASTVPTIDIPLQIKVVR